MSRPNLRLISEKQSELQDLIMDCLALQAIYGSNGVSFIKLALRRISNGFEIEIRALNLLSWLYSD